MNVVVFLGPSLPEGEARAELGATYLPPAAQGDVYRAARERPFAIGLVDGLFERVPSVWHKEILWAISRGIHVFGAASMGALRAAELARFGMRGVGAVYEAFATGTLEDDDEVAVAHADAAGGYRPLSDAMVNIRATLRASVEAGVVDEALAGRLASRAKALFYPDRTFTRLLACAEDDGEPAVRLAALRAFVAAGAVDLKRSDALALLRAVHGCVEAGDPPPPAQFSFARTEAWDQVVAWAEAQPSLAGPDEPLDAGLLAAEAALSGDGGWALLAAGLTRAAAAALAASAPAAVMTEARAARDRAWRRAEGAGAIDPGGGEGAADGQAHTAWLTRNGLTGGSYPGFVERDAQNEWFKDRFGGEVSRFLVDEFRASGQYEAVSARTRSKAALLTAHGLSEPTLDDAQMDRPALLAWYFEQRLGRPVPEDLARYCRHAGIGGIPALERQAVRELLFQRLSARPRHA